MGFAVGCALVWCEVQGFLYGGYFKDSAGDPEGSDRGVVFSDLWVLDFKTWQWDKVSLAPPFQPPPSQALLWLQNQSLLCRVTPSA